MRSRDRLAALAFLAAALLSWTGVAIVLTSEYPDSLAVKLGMAVAIGLAVALTVTPLAWLAVVARGGRAARRAGWGRAARRGALVGAAATLFVGLQVTGTSSLPMVAFAVLLVLLVELTLTYRR